MSTTYEEVKTYLDALLAEKQNYTQLRTTLLTDLDNLLNAFKTSKNNEAIEIQAQVDIIEQITTLKTQIISYNYHENQLDQKIQETRNVLAAMNGDVPS